MAVREAKRHRIGLLLGDIRKKRNISQESAAKAIGISRTHLSNIEVGRAAPALKWLPALCAFYAVPVDELLKQVENDTQGTVAAVDVHQRTSTSTPGDHGFSKMEEWAMEGLLLLPETLRLKVVKACTGNSRSP